MVVVPLLRRERLYILRLSNANHNSRVALQYLFPRGGLCGEPRNLVPLCCCTTAPAARAPVVTATLSACGDSPASCDGRASHGDGHRRLMLPGRPQGRSKAAAAHAFTQPASSRRSWRPHRGAGRLAGSGPLPPCTSCSVACQSCSSCWRVTGRSICTAATSGASSCIAGSSGTATPLSCSSSWSSAGAVARKARSTSSLGGQSRAVASARQADTLGMRSAFSIWTSGRI